MSLIDVLGVLLSYVRASTMTVAGQNGHEREWPMQDAAIVPECSGRRIGGTGSFARWLWYDRPVQWQLLATVILINLVAAAAAGLVVIYNARNAAAVEVAASMEVAEQLVRKTVDRLARETANDNYTDPLSLQALEDLPLRLSQLRHVRILVVDASGRRYRWSSDPSAHGDAGSEEGEKAPRWFSALFAFDNLTRQVPVTLSGRQIGTVLLVGRPADEIAEVWHDVSGLAPVALIANLLVIVLFYLAIGRLLNPLTSLAAGLRELEQGRFQHRLPRPKVRELAEIVARFNTLAAALEAARKDNTRLNRRLVSAQDDERRQIAMELHDELGACLFALRANVLSVQRLIESPRPDAAELMRKRTGTLVEVTERIQTTNRRLLRSLRPMAVGQAALADVVTGLIADFEQNDPDHAFKLDVGQLRSSYSDSIDLTVYRCIQEGVTNAIRHAQASAVAVSVEEVTKPNAYSDAGAPSIVLRLSVTDDGNGYASGTKSGLGLAGMRERVRALGGTLVMSNRPEGGARLGIEIPVEEADQAGTADAQSERP